MKLVKSLLLGSAATLVAVAGAQAADLPSKKASPVNFVKVCDAYGAGFFYIPGTDTCIKVGGRVRADYAASAKQTIYATTASSAGFDTATGARFNTIGTSKSAENVYGWEARGRVDLDARTATAWGTVQTVTSVRLARTTGILAEVGPALSSTTAGATLEAAYIRFAGFTFGAARDNFSFMPSTFYGAGHWSSFANGAKQLAYTAVLGGGFSATIAIQDATDTTAGGVVAAQYLDASNLRTNFGATLASPAYSYNNLPQVNGRLDFDQAWGSASVMGALGKAVGDNATAVYDAEKTVYAVGAGVKLNLPMIAAGDVLYLNGGYADGMTEYTVNWTSFKSSDTRRNVGGFVVTSPSWIYTLNSAGASGKVETLKSWNLAALFTHYWAPQWRHSFLASYGKVDGTTTSKALTWGQTGAFGDGTVWNVGTQLAWLPTSNFEIGVDVLYARVEQDVRRQNGTISGSTFTAGATTLANSTVTKEKTGNLTGRLRVERTF